MAVDRNDLVEELKLRKLIRKSIKLIKERKVHQEYENILDESVQKDKFRQLVRKLILAEAGEPKGVHRSTGIMKLEKLLNNIIPTIESDYKDLTTDIDQRESFRSHVINAVENALAPEKLNAESDPEIGELDEKRLVVNLDIDEDPMFIDVPRPGKEEEEKKGAPDDEDHKEFGKGLEHHDETGRNEAYETYKSTGPQIEKAYVGLANEKDKNLFYDYLVANLKLYFDKFEEEMQADLPEPDSEIYRQQTSNQNGSRAPLEERYQIDFNSLKNLTN